MWPNPQDLVTFTEKILNGKTLFFVQWIQVNHWRYVFHKIVRESVISRTISKNTLEKENVNALIIFKEVFLISLNTFTPFSFAVKVFKIS